MYVTCGDCSELVELPDSSPDARAPCPKCGRSVGRQFVSQLQGLNEPEHEAGPRHQLPRARPVTRVSPLSPESELARRAEGLLGEWRAAHSGLRIARVANVANFVLILAVAFVSFLRLAADTRQDREALDLIVEVLGWFTVLPAVAHAAGQLMCASLPGSHGGHLTRFCWMFNLGSIVALLWCAAVFSLSVGALAASLMILFAFVLWVLFFFALGRGLEDRRLTSAAAWYGFWCVLSVALATIVGGVALAEIGPARKWAAFLWVAVVYGTTLALGVGYHILLGTACRALARRAPVASLPPGA